MKTKSNLLNKFVMKLTNFERQIKNASTSQILATSTATTTSFVFQESGEYEITLIATDNNGATSSTSTILKVEPFSFAIITDLHIGWGIPDYNSKGYDPSNERSSQGTFNSQDYYITQRLEKAIDWINKNYKKENIKFVVVLGDISDTAEYSEFLKAREILNKLEIPYLPIIGNHDIWPYTQKMTADPDNRLFSIKERAKDGELLGDTYFETVFWGSANATNTQRIKTLFDYFERQEDLPQYQGPPYFSNYAFSYGGIKFVALDFASRNYYLLMSLINGIEYKESIDWLKENLESCKEGENFVIFTHYPFIELWGGFMSMKNIKTSLLNSKCKLLNLGGHTHINRITPQDNKYNVIETEPTSQIPVNPFYTLKGEFLRLVQINGNDIKEINYNTLINGFPQAINPYIKTNKEEISVGKKIKFLANTKNLKAEDIFSYEWDFGENYSAQCIRPENKSEYCEVIYNQPGIYKVSLKVIPNYDKNYSENLYWYLNVKEKPKPEYKISSLPLGIHAFLEGEKLFDLTLEENAQSTEATALLGKEKSPFTPIGALKIHFEKAKEDIGFSNLIADTDLNKKKTIFYMPQWPEIVEKEKILYVPK